MKDEAEDMEVMITLLFIALCKYASFYQVCFGTHLHVVIFIFITLHCNMYTIHRCSIGLLLLSALLDVVYHGHKLLQIYSTLL